MVHPLKTMTMMQAMLTTTHNPTRRALTMKALRMKHPLLALPTKYPSNALDLPIAGVSEIDENWQNGDIKPLPEDKSEGVNKDETAGGNKDKPQEWTMVKSRVMKNH
jgi:hypothetical protein